ncbi:MAG: nucleoid-associated protein [Bacteroidetes bacterium]|nr:nucleoid-associated protein [Bacteroidota bacterium]
MGKDQFHVTLDAPLFHPIPEAMITLKKLAIHEIIRKSSTTEAKPICSEELMPVDDPYLSFIDSLVNTYKNDSILYAIFDPGSVGKFPDDFELYRNSLRSQEDFLNFSIKATHKLVPLISQKNLAKGGYYIYAEYQNDGVDNITIFLLRDIEGKTLKRTPKAFKIATIEYLDTNNLTMACRIDEKRYEQKESNYLSFTMFKQQDVSDYFKEWISIQEKETSTAYTKTLLDVINQIDPPVDSDTKQRLSTDELRTKVYNLVSSNTARVVNLHVLSEQLYKNPGKISEFAEKNKFTIDTEFRYDPKSLKSFIRLEVNADGINMKFSRGDWEKGKVRISEDDPNLVIIKSKIFADALRNEIQNK